jgi:predicted DNA-binding transcriptional regulator AlpA
LLFARDAFQTMGVHRVAKQRKLRIKKIVVDDPSLSIQEFCDAEGLGRATYYNLKKEGRAPREMRVAGLIRITHADRVAWRKRMVKESESA